MATYLLKWNPNRWEWKGLVKEVKKVRHQGYADNSWSCGNTKRIKRGDGVFLMRIGMPPCGIIGFGEVTEEPYEGGHWARASRNKRALYVGVRFYALLDPKEGVLAVDDLKTEHLADFPWHIQSGGITIPPAAAAELESAWSAFLTANGQGPVSLPDEVVAPARFFEGATRLISVNVYERNSYARQRCIEHHGCCCSVCGFDFEKVFGEQGRGFIHVHHLKALCRIRKKYQLDPVEDLRPVCPNCHAMIHRGDKMLSIESLRKTLRTQARRATA